MSYLRGVKTVGVVLVRHTRVASAERWNKCARVLARFQRLRYRACSSSDPFSLVTLTLHLAQPRVTSPNRYPLIEKQKVQISQDADEASIR